MGLWAITSYFNPAGCRHRFENYLRFQRALAVPLLTVELCFGDTPDLGPGQAEKLVQIRGLPRNLLWQKERLLNLALPELPEEATSVCWLDCDLLFPDDSWPAQAELLLERHPLIQLFASVHHLPQEMADVDPACLSGPVVEGLYWQPSAMRNHLADTPILFRKFGREEMARTGNPGLAWAASKELLLSHGLYDRAIVGHGDRLFFAAASGTFEVPERMLPPGSRARMHWQQWAEGLQGSLSAGAGFLEQPVFHLWHGDGANRRYRERLAILQEHQFDPRTDITEDESGCWRWQGSKPALEAGVARYLLGLAAAS